MRLSERLRESTAGKHSRWEEHSFSGLLFSARMDPDTYVTYPVGLRAICAAEVCDSQDRWFSQ